MTKKQAMAEARRRWGRTAAKAIAEEKLTEKYLGEYAPVLLRTLGYVVVIWRIPESGWTYRILDEDGRTLEGKRDVLHGNMFTMDDRDQTERHARQHLAQMIYDRNKNRTGVEVISNESNKHEHLSWADWQDRYAKARERGANDELAREIASGLKPMLAEVPSGK